MFCQEFSLLSDALMKGLFVEQHFSRKREVLHGCANPIFGPEISHDCQLCHRKPTNKIHTSEDNEVRGEGYDPQYFLQICVLCLFPITAQKKKVEKFTAVSKRVS